MTKINVQMRITAQLKTCIVYHVEMDVKLVKITTFLLEQIGRCAYVQGCYMKIK